MSEPIYLDAVMTNTGINALITRPDGIKKAITHIGLSPSYFVASADMDALPGEVQRWPIIDGTEMGDNQISIYAEFEWAGSEQPIRSIALYSDDTIMAVHSSDGELEAVLTRYNLQDAFWQLAFTGAPANSITVITTGARYNQDVVDQIKLQVGVAVGAVLWFAAPAAPGGYLKCNGAAIDRTLYSALFSAIGTVFGIGNGSTTFSLPDLRGEFIRGFDDGKDIDTGRAFGSSQRGSQMIVGQEFYTVNGNSGDGYGLLRKVDSESAGRPGNTWDKYDGGTPIDTATYARLTNSFFNTGQTALNLYHSRPRNIALLPCIKY